MSTAPDEDLNGLHSQMRDQRSAENANLLTKFEGYKIQPASQSNAESQNVISMNYDALRSD